MPASQLDTHSALGRSLSPGIIWPRQRTAVYVSQVIHRAARCRRATMGRVYRGHGRRTGHGTRGTLSRIFSWCCRRMSHALARWGWWGTTRPTGYAPTARWGAGTRNFITTFQRSHFFVVHRRRRRPHRAPRRATSMIITTTAIIITPIVPADGDRDRTVAGAARAGGEPVPDS
jgi:hypothetical protein